MCRLLDRSAGAMAALADCFEGGVNGVAERVLAKQLVAGDLVLSSESDVSRVIVNQHMVSAHQRHTSLTHAMGLRESAANWLYSY